MGKTWNARPKTYSDSTIKCNLLLCSQEINQSFIRMRDFLNTSLSYLYLTQTKTSKNTEVWINLIQQNSQDDRFVAISPDWHKKARGFQNKWNRSGNWHIWPVWEELCPSLRADCYWKLSRGKIMRLLTPWKTKNCRNIIIVYYMTELWINIP